MVVAVAACPRVMPCSLQRSPTVCCISWASSSSTTSLCTSPNAKTRPAHVEHDLKFRTPVSGSRLVDSGSFEVHQRDGSSRTITVKALHDFWPGLAGYDNFRGYASGMWKGETWSDSFSVDLSDAEQMRQVGMLTETFAEFRDGDRVGYGLVEMVFMGAYPRYGYQGW